MASFLTQAQGVIGSLTAIAGIGDSVHFSPVKLVFFVGWVYCCFYFVQLILLSSLVPESMKSWACFAGLFFGPIVLLVFFLVRSVRKSLESDEGLFSVMLVMIKNTAESLNISVGGRSQLIFLDGSGNEIKNIFGDSKRNSKKDNRILKLTEYIISSAIDDRASDILIDAKSRSNYMVRFRVDGVLRNFEELEAGVCKAVINSIKAACGMDIAERRRPQDGSFAAKGKGINVSFRVASAGAMHGEKLIIRILDQNDGVKSIEELGFTKKQVSIVKHYANKPQGMILLCGPTGSGKTTTLYSILNELDLFQRNVITVEDPIEYVIPNASQIEINDKAGITFAKTLRSILRQDPDVICVGEIRDEETASIALKSSQTGHLVLATMHANSNAAALVRLLDLGISPVLMSSGLNVIFSQRLLRVLCDGCKTRAQFSASQIADFRKKKINYANCYEPAGCKYCDGTGYYGRTSICDVLLLDDKLRGQLAKNGPLVTMLRQNGDKKGLSNLNKQGLKKVTSGITSFEELERVTG